jgi:hypothetical protein
MPPSAGDLSGHAGSRGLAACFEAARVCQKAKIFHELNHDTYKIDPYPANASFQGARPSREGVGPGEDSVWT